MHGSSNLLVEAIRRIDRWGDAEFSDVRAGANMGWEKAVDRIAADAMALPDSLARSERIPMALPDSHGAGRGSRESTPPGAEAAAAAAVVWRTQPQSRLLWGCPFGTSTSWFVRPFWP